MDGDAIPTAVLVTVGDELLLGETVDTNAAWLGRELAAVGIEVRRHHTVGDDDEEIRRAVADGLAAADLVLVTGGLGPTADDRTRPAVASLLGRSLEVSPALLDELERRFRARGLGPLPAANLGQAEVPDGATVLSNARGTAPGLALEHEGALVVLLPGVPAELRGIWKEGLRQLIEERLAPRLAPAVHRVLHTTGVPESRLAELVEAVLPKNPEGVSIAFLPDPTGVDLRLTVRRSDVEEARRRLDAVEAVLAPVIEPWRFDAASGDLAEAVLEALRARGLRLAVAESCTGGLVAHRLTTVPGASEVFLGGVVAYANEAKVDLLGVGEEMLARHGAVSEAVARAMAEGARRRLGADAGVGVTGIAGPGGGSAGKPVGTVWLAAAMEERVQVARAVVPGSRLDVQRRAAQAALRLLLDVVRAGGSDARGR